MSHRFLSVINLALWLQAALFYTFAQATTLHVPANYGTIQSAINASANSDTVLVASGTYAENINFNGHRIVVTSQFINTADTADISATRINGRELNAVVQIIEGEDSTTALIGFTIYNGFAYPEGGGGIRIIDSSPRIEHNIIRDNLADVGGGILCDHCNANIRYNRILNNDFVSPLGNPGGGISVLNNSNVVIEHNLMQDNRNQDGGGVAVFESMAIIRHNLFIDNFAMDIGGGIRCDNSNPLIINNLFYGNEATHGGGIATQDGGNPLIKNCILWNNRAQNGDQINNAGGSPVVSFSCIQGGYQGEGNISQHPAFRTSLPDLYFLSSTACGDSVDSPCIDAGDPSISDGEMSCTTGLGSERSDIGPYGGLPEDSITAIRVAPKNPQDFSLLKVYPNPFNSTATFTFGLEKSESVELIIFDLIGRKILSRKIGQLTAGVHTQLLDFTPFATGMYIAEMTTESRAVHSKLRYLR